MRSYLGHGDSCPTSFDECRASDKTAGSGTLVATDVFRPNAGLSY